MTIVVCHDDQLGEAFFPIMIVDKALSLTIPSCVVYLVMCVCVCVCVCLPVGVSLGLAYMQK